MGQARSQATRLPTREPTREVDEPKAGTGRLPLFGPEMTPRKRRKTKNRWLLLARPAQGKSKKT